MEKQDARTLNDDALHERRKQVVRLLELGESRTRICCLTELSPTAVGKIIRLYQTGGPEALKPRQRGRRIGEERRLSPDQETSVQKLICDSSPADSCLPYPVWTRSAVKALIEKEYGVILATRTVGHYLRRWNFIPKKNSVPGRGLVPGRYQGVDNASIRAQTHARGYAPRNRAYSAGLPAVRLTAIPPAKHTEEDATIA